MAVKKATSRDGKTYDIGSDKGLDFVNNAAAGATMTGGDGSTWTKNADGTTTIKTTNGGSFSVGGPVSGGGGGKNSSSTVSNAVSALGAAAASKAQLDNMAQSGYNYKPGMDIKLSGNIAAGDPIFGNAGRDANGFADASTAFYKTLPNGWVIPNTFTQGSLKPGDSGWVDTTQGSAWSQDAVKASGRSVSGSGRGSSSGSGGSSTRTGTSGGGASASQRQAGYNDAGLQAAGLIDPISQYKTEYANAAAQWQAAKDKGDEAGMAAAQKLMDDAHAKAESYRAQFGYSGGVDGSEYVGLNGSGMPQTGAATQGVSQDAQVQALRQALVQQGQTQIPAWQMPAAPEVQAYTVTPYDQTEQGQQARAGYQALMDKINSTPAFSYDPTTDPMYQQYAETYARQGRQAMEDTLGQVAARTGGLASSYAGAAAQQQYQNYMAQLADRVPELRQLAYSMYVDDYNRQLGLADRAYQMYSGDRDSYLDAARLDQNSWATKAQLDQSRWGTEAQMGYNAYRDQVADDQWNQEFLLRQIQDAEDQARWQSQFDRGVYENDRDYGRSVYTDTRNFDYSKGIDERDFEYQKEQDAWNRQMTERQYADSLKSELRDRVDRYGYMPTQQDAEMYGLTQAELVSLQEQARHVRAADASKYYSGW